MSGRVPYQPSNGTEGMWFFHRFCDRCKKDGDDPCPILPKTMVYNPGDPEYPKEWTWVPVDLETVSCSAFEEVDRG